MTAELVARVVTATLPDGSSAVVEQWASRTPAPSEDVFAAMVLLGDGAGRYAVVFSPRRGEWGAPGGWREPDESVAACAVREVFEETGVALDPALLEPVGYELFEPALDRDGVNARGAVMQLYRARVAAGTALHAGAHDARDAQWVTGEQFEQLSGGRFWWPLVGRLLSQSPLDAPGAGETRRASRGTRRSPG